MYPRPDIAVSDKTNTVGDQNRYLPRTRQRFNQNRHWWSVKGAVTWYQTLLLPRKLTQLGIRAVTYMVGTRRC